MALAVSGSLGQGFGVWGLCAAVLSVAVRTALQL